MIFEELINDIKQGKFLENLNEEKIQFLSGMKLEKDGKTWSWIRGDWTTPHITRPKIIELIYTLEFYYSDKEEQLQEIYQKLQALEIDLYSNYWNLPFLNDRRTDILSPLHFAVEQPSGLPKTDKKVLKRILDEMRKKNQLALLEVHGRSKKHSKKNTNARYLNVNFDPTLMQCSIMDLAILNNNWSAVEFLLEEGFEADQFFEKDQNSNIVPLGMPRLHLAYQLATPQLFARLIASPKFNINFRCRYYGMRRIGEQLGYEGYTETILLDALAYYEAHGDVYMDKLSILLGSSNIDFTQALTVNCREVPLMWGRHLFYENKVGMTALDLVLRTTPRWDKKPVEELVKAAIRKKMQECFNNVYETSKTHLPLQLSNIIAQYALLAPEELAMDPPGRKWVSEFTTVMFKFNDARQQDTWEVRKDQNDAKEERKDQPNGTRH